MTAQNMGRKILVEAGHEVTCVSNGAAALKKITEQRPDIVILDVYMPGYTGLEVCQRIRETRDLARTPVLLSVGKLEPFSKEDAQRVRAAALIVKPFEATELVSTISRIGEFVEPRRDPKSKSESGTKSKLPERGEDMPSPTVKSPKPVTSRAEVIPAMPVETKSSPAPGNMAEFEVIA